MKTKLLFVIDSLNCAGAEKSLVTLLSFIDYTKYDVDLQLLSFGGEFEKFVPHNVNILPELEYFKFCTKEIIEQLRSFNLKFLYSRIYYSLAIRFMKKYNRADFARILWKTISSHIYLSHVKYDVAIAYAHDFPTFYVAEKIIATKKLAWINVGLNLNQENTIFQEKFYNKFNYIVAVSSSAYNQFLDLYPIYKQKLRVIYDIINPKFILKQAKEKCTVSLDNSAFKILTVARLDYEQKGYDISLETCKILKNRGIKFKWYALGKGNKESSIKQYITDNHLEDYFELLGVHSNPYPFYVECDIYVQTSRYEGFGLSIAEARILNKPVVTTEFDAVWNQMVQGKNGIVVPIDATAVADAIQELIENPRKMKAISDYQRTEKKGNTEELQKFYQLIES